MQNFQNNRSFREKKLYNKKCVFIKQNGIYVRDVLSLHLHKNFKKNAFKKCGSYSYFSDAITH